MNMKRICAMLLALTLSIGLLAGCGGDAAESGSTTAETTLSGEVTYRVTLTDGLGTPITRGVVVKFMQNGAQAAMQTPDANGVAEKTMARGEYTVELQFTDKEYKYDTTNVTLTGEAPELTILLNSALGDKTQSLTVGAQQFEAYYVSAGSTQITLDSANRSYYLFAPTESGTYEFSLAGSDAAIGHYGAPHFVQELSAAEVKDNKFTVSVRPEMIGTGDTGTSVYVIGVDAGEGEAALCIQRIGEHEWTVSDEPWTPYVMTHTPAAYTLPAGAVIGEFDLTKTYTIVKDANGFFHLDSEDGPQVMVRLGKKAELKYLDPYETILEYTGINCYFYDDNGDFVKKENYIECITQYIACADQESGLYPLTEDLRYVIEMNGQHNGWYDESKNYIFKDDMGNIVSGIQKETAWLFMCCYIQ